MHYEKLKALMERSFWWKEKLFFKDKSFWSSIILKIKLLVEAYVKKLSDICSLRNVKFYDYESYNILWEEVYKEKFCYSLRGF